jgi:hypothetical protein
MPARGGGPKESAMKRIKHWQDPANAILGAWLVISPWVLGFSEITVAVASTVALGVVLIANSLGAMRLPAAWEEWLDVVFGVALMLAPTVLGYDGVRTAFANALVTGAAVTALAIWVLLTDDDFATGVEGKQG